MLTEYNYKNNAHKQTCFFWDNVFRHWVFIAQLFKTMQRPVHSLGLETLNNEHPVMERNIPEKWCSQLHCFKHPKSFLIATW
jgi:hypothetical protein